MNFLTSVRAAISAPFALFRRWRSGRWWDETTCTTIRDAKRATPGFTSERQLVDDGVGKPVTRVYQIDIAGAVEKPEFVFREFLHDPNSFLKRRYAYFSPNELVGQSRVTVHIGGPWDGPVEVIEVTETSCRLGTLDGHLEAGWIEFSVDPDTEVFTVRSTATAGDPAFWLLHKVFHIGRWLQADMWSSLCENFAESAGIDPIPLVSVDTVEHEDD